MKNHSRFNRILLIAFCAAILLTSMNMPVFAASSEDAENPTIIDSLPYSTTETFYKKDTGRTTVTEYEDKVTGEIVTKEEPVYEYHYAYYYRYEANETGRVTIQLKASGTFCQVSASVNGSDAGYIYSDGTQSLAVDVRKGETLSIAFSVMEDTTASLNLSMAPSPMGSKYKPFWTDAEELAEGLEIDLRANESVYYKFTVPEDGVLRFYTTNVVDETYGGVHSLPWGQQIIFDDAMATVFAYSMSDCLMMVSAGDEIVMRMDCPGYATGGSYALHMEYTEPIFLDATTKARLFNGMYIVEGSSSMDGSTYNMYGVRFSYSKKTVSAIDLKNCIPLGTYKFNYNESNGALELTDEYGNPATYNLIVVEDYNSDLGVGVKFVYSGSYLLKKCTEVPEPSEVVAKTLTGQYEDIFKGEFCEALTFDYEAKTVVIAKDWNSEGVVYTMGNFDVFTGEMEITSEKGKQYTIIVSNGQIIYRNNPLTPVQAPHVHEYTSVVTAPTCTEDGYTTYTCACGDTYTGDPVAASGHAYTDVVTAPTCMNAGFTTHTCSACGDVKTDTEVAATGHAYGAWTDAGESHKQVCANCKDEKTAPHNWNEGETVKEPTEDADGELRRTCADCGAINVQLIPSLGHVHKHEAVVTAPTCTADGYTTYTCRCGDSYQQAWEKAKGHNYSSSVIAPTCEAEGYTAHTCANCGDTYQDSKVAAKGHAYSKQVTAPTCEEDGYTTYTCGNCGHTYQDNKTNATGHNYDQGVEADGQITYTCKNCGGQYTVEVVTNAFTVPGNLTGLVNGSQDYAWIATEDGFLVIDNVSAVSGIYTTVTINGEEVVATENGYAVSMDDSVVVNLTTYSPIEVNIPVYMQGSQHAGLEDGAMEFDVTFSGWTIFEQPWKAPADGWVSFIVTQSNVNRGDLIFRIIDEEGQFYNQYEFGLDSNGNQFVSVEVTKGEVLMVVAYEDTMAVEGKLHISVMQGQPAPHVHTYDDGVVTEPTCTADGYTTFTCTVCGESYQDNKVEASHAYVGVVTEPTCTEGGFTTYTCNICGDTYVAAGDKALYHSFGDWEVVKEATTTETGIRKQTCTRCGAEETEEIPVIQQAPTTAPATQPATTAPATPATTGGGDAQQTGGMNTMMIVMIVVVVVIAGAIVAVIVIKKKK